MQRGVEQEPGAKKRHLNTREFKQQQEALHSLEKEAQAMNAELEQRQREESALQERLHSIEQQAQADIFIFQIILTNTSTAPAIQSPLADSIVPASQASAKAGSMGSFASTGRP